MDLHDACSIPFPSFVVVCVPRASFLSHVQGHQPPVERFAFLHDVFFVQQLFQREALLVQDQLQARPSHTSVVSTPWSVTFPSVARGRFRGFPGSATVRVRLTSLPDARRRAHLHWTRLREARDAPKHRVCNARPSRRMKRDREDVCRRGQTEDDPSLPRIPDEGP